MATRVLALGALWAACAAAAAARGRGEPRTREELDISTAVDHEQLPNGGMLWGMERPGNDGVVALVVRAGARQEDVGRSGAALSTARWVLASYSPLEALRQGVIAELDMLPGGAMFILRGPSGALPGAFARLLKATLRPTPKLMALGRDQALLETRRLDFFRSVGDAVSAACWSGTSFELPAWGQKDTLATLDDGYERIFHSTWYQPRNMTVIALGPRGFAPYRAALAASSRARMSRETVAPGEPALPVHQVQRQGVVFSLAGVAMPGPQSAGPALLLRGRAEELLGGALLAGKLQGPVMADIVWTRKAAIVWAAVQHTDADIDERAQGKALGVIEEALRAAARLSDEDLNALRKREGARLSRAFSDPDVALRHLGQLATATDAPVDLRHAAMASQTEVVRKAFNQSLVENFQMTIRQLPRSGGVRP